MQNSLQSLRFLKQRIIELENNQKPVEVPITSSGHVVLGKASDSIDNIYNEVERLYILIIDMQTRLLNQDDYR